MLFNVRPERRKTGFSGQNLVEFGVTMPFIVVMMMFITEVGRVWFFYESLKMAAMDAAYSAAAYHNPNVGMQTAQQKLTAAGVGGTVNVTQVPNQHAYQATVTGNFVPIFGAIQLPFVGATLFNGFPITYTALKESAMY